MICSERAGCLVANFKLTHTPFIVFKQSDDGFEVVIERHVDRLYKYTDSTEVLVQWRGEWRSDFFRFTVGQVKKFKAISGHKFLGCLGESVPGRMVLFG